ncbi:short-chain dehydrogenase reductase [Seiridium cupressi]
MTGQTAVVTGGTSGLGLASAAHLINLGATEVIISSRNPSRSRKALEELEKITGGKSKDKVRVLELDMVSYASVVEFAKKVKEIRTGNGGVDIVILNAGTIGVEPKITAEGWEQNIQVNTLSTTLLAVLLLPHMKAERANRSSPAHLSIVGSMRFADPNISEWAKWTTEKGEGVLEHLSKPENWSSGNAMYAGTKLLVTYALRELVERARGSDGRLFGKSPENGARTYMASVTTTESDHGRFVQFYKNGKQLKSLEDKVLTSEVGRRMQAQVWKEITGELVAKVPDTREFLVV